MRVCKRKNDNILYVYRIVLIHSEADFIGENVDDEKSFQIYDYITKKYLLSITEELFDMIYDDLIELRKLKIEKLINESL